MLPMEGTGCKEELHIDKFLIKDRDAELIIVYFYISSITFPKCTLNTYVSN